ncbi:MAG: rhomboid family intramembrane serine protease [Cytophagales bacterium]|nr:rhomboid family intramembrane serine protease [Armatimonadota bacterium]
MIPLRDENPTRITPYLTWFLLAANIAVYILQLVSGMQEGRTGLVGGISGWTMVPIEVTRGVDVATNGLTLQPHWLTLFTAMFMHGGLLHLGGNLLFLLIFGNNIEDALGHLKYGIFYLLCGVLASAAQIASNPTSVIPTLGASGAIAGVLGAYLVLFPRARVDTLVFLVFFVTRIRVPAFLLLGFWIASQFFSQFTRAMAEREGGGVAYLAHIGGFLAGMALIKLFGAKPPPSGPEGYSDNYPPPTPYGSYRR